MGVYQTPPPVFPFWASLLHVLPPRMTLLLPFQALGSLPKSLQFLPVNLIIDTEKLCEVPPTSMLLKFRGGTSFPIFIHHYNCYYRNNTSPSSMNVPDAMLNHHFTISCSFWFQSFCRNQESFTFLTACLASQCAAACFSCRSPSLYLATVDTAFSSPIM